MTLEARNRGLEDGDGSCDAAGETSRTASPAAAGMPPLVSIIIPALDEAAALPGTLRLVRSACEHLGPPTASEVLVVDGGSGDGTAELARGMGVIVLESPRGRALQMNAGAERARGEWLLFLHADTALGQTALHELVGLSGRRAAYWGCCRVRLSGRALGFRMIERMMRVRSELTGIVTGDQGLFVRRSLFRGLGGYPELPLMEDLALCRRLRRLGRPVKLRAEVVTSSRKWEQEGLLRTVLLMWRLRAAYFLGTDPAALHHRYYRRSTSERD